MTAIVLPFPKFHVRIVRDGDAWLVLCRDYGWLHSDSEAALVDAEWIAAGHGVPVLTREVAT